ncbi:hypothetical protein [Pseudomonas sp. PI1]|uniref:hypothetical protein n=1 Tax=Pseudomonas sp. PI1 TaxID=1582493 RepID=UPI0005BE8761|nr:hypothetical protein [Pseudomonas sp. PI1]KWR85521.1 hypothetical protein RN02_02375 [Pseudomonas sp. PI1]
MQLSTGLRNAVMAVSSFRAALAGCVINVYSGTIPATADAALSGDAVLLYTISVDGGGGGLGWESAAVGGVLSKSTSEAWKGTVVAAGTISFFRLQAPADTNGASTTDIRIQGTAGVLGFDLNMSKDAVIVSEVQTVDYATITVPASI